MEEDSKGTGLSNVIRIDDERVRDHLGRIVRGTVEETLNAMLEAEADRLCNAERYERTQAKANTLQQAAEDRVADLSGRLEREEAERRMLQQQKDNLQAEADKLREMLSVVRNKVNQAEGQGARAHAEAVAERARAADLRRQLEAFQAKKRRWWQF
jgi:predicted RNase H-like nuclease (RuvC/YqgF family)